MPKTKLESFFDKKRLIDNESDKKNKTKTLIKKIKIIEPNIEIPRNLAEGILLSVEYSGDKEQIFTKLYSPNNNKIYFWYDNSNHHPYLITDLSESELRRNEKLMSHKGLLSFKKVKKTDLLHDRDITMVKIETKDPLSIGGRRDSIREILTRSWEDRIRYHHSYIMDRSLTPGARYKISDGSLKEIEYELEKDQLTEIKFRFKKDLNKYEEILKRYLPRILDKIPFIKRTALDIEVETLVEERIPDPKTAENRVLAVSLVENKGKEKVYVLKNGQNMGKRPKQMPDNVKVELFEDEKELLINVFNDINQIPVLLTFNGDNFDLKYLYYRAQRLGITTDKIPIRLTSDSAGLKYGIHIDLYSFFHNVSIRVYAFGNKYIQSTLNEIGKNLLGQEKIEIQDYPGRIPLLELAHYCWNDAKITMDLTTYNDELTMKLIILLARISHLPLEDVTRTAVSAWIRNLIYYEHRQKNILIPNQEDILKEKGEIHSKAIIKDKKYRGAIVIEPVKGTHFNVTVMDFSSLYPSIMKEYNLSYETIECPDPDCKKNILPGTDYCVCTNKIGIISAIVGFLRDIRVDWFKKKAKDKTTPKEYKEYYKVIEQALKVFINASYGVLGSDNFPLYTPPVADATTAIGRYAITKVIEEAKKLDVPVLYSDTDSIFLKDPTENQINSLINWSTENLGIDLDVDKIYRYVALSDRKKNYLGVYDSGDVDIKGLTGKKKHVPLFIQNAFNDMINVLSKVKNSDEFVRAKNKIKDIATNLYQDLSNKKINLEELAFKVQMNRPLSSYTKTTPQHIKAAKLLANNGKEVRAGDIITFVKTKNDLGVKPLILAEWKDIDTDKYKESIESTFEQVLDALDIDFKEIMGMRKLSDFFA